MRRLYRDRWDKKLGGVCGGLGQYLKFDPTIIRLIVIFVCIFTVILPVVLLYLVVWIVIPQGPPTYIQLNCKKLRRNMKNRMISGICSGLADFLHVDPTLVRIVTAIAVVITGFFPGFFAYVIGTWLIPEKP